MVASPHQAVGETIIARPRLFGLGRPRPAAATVKASGEAARLLLDDFLQRQPLLAAINGLIAALTALASAGTAPPGVLLVWLLAMLVAQASCSPSGWRCDPIRSYRPAPGRAAHARQRLTGLVWGSAGVVLVHHDAPPASILVPFVLAGMSAGSIAALPAHPPAFFVFIWAALVPYALQLGASPACPG